MIYDFRTPGTIYWTASKYDQQALYTLPYIEMRGRQLNYSALLNSIKSWTTNIGNKLGVKENPYAGLYSGDESTVYVLPFFSDYHHSISQNWQSDSTTDLPNELVSGYVAPLAKLYTPSVGVLKLNEYKGSTPQSYSFSFSLVNTLTDEIGSVTLNKLFLENLIRDNLHQQVNAVTTMPPLVYEILVPGVRWSPAAVISSIDVKNRGVLNIGVVGDGEQYIYPDAWEVNITITELFTESKELWDGAVSVGTDGISGIKTRIFQ